MSPAPTPRPAPDRTVEAIQAATTISRYQPVANDLTMVDADFTFIPVTPQMLKVIAAMENEENRRVLQNFIREGAVRVKACHAVDDYTLARTNDRDTLEQHVMGRLTAELGGEFTKAFLGQALTWLESEGGL